MKSVSLLSFFSSDDKHLGVLSPFARSLVNVEMHMKMKEADFQNVVYPCCGLMEIRKWSIQHNRCYGDIVEKQVIAASAQHCPTCGQFCGGSIKLVQHMEEYHGAAMMFACSLCRNPYVTKVALDCHLAWNPWGGRGSKTRLHTEI